MTHPARRFLPSLHCKQACQPLGCIPRSPQAPWRRARGARARCCLLLAPGHCCWLPGSTTPHPRPAAAPWASPCSPAARRALEHASQALGQRWQPCHPYLQMGGAAATSGFPAMKFQVRRRARGRAALQLPLASHPWLLCLPLQPLACRWPHVLCFSEHSTAAIMPAAPPEQPTRQALCAPNPLLMKLRHAQPNALLPAPSPCHLAVPGGHPGRPQRSPD